MRKYLLILVLAPAYLSGQIFEDFSDGDLTQNPAWTGDLSHFKFSTSSAVPADQRPALQLDAAAAGSSYLSVQQDFNDDLEWQFWIKHSFNSSAGNFSRIYLVSDQADLGGPLQGCFLQVGGAVDSVILYRQDSLATERIFRLSTAFAGNSTNALRFKVERSGEGTWKFYCDSLGGHSLSFQGQFSDPGLAGGNFFGLYCQYTSSNITKFYFDDIYAGPLIVDTAAPSLLSADIVNPSEILLTFNEPVDQVTAENPLNYEITQAIGNPYEAIRLLDPSQVHLFFDQGLENGVEYVLNINEMKDLAGNNSGVLSVPVFYYVIAPFDLIFTEIMADPTPPRNLPEFEYLELYNRCAVSLKIEGLRLKIGGSEFDLPDKTIAPGAFLLICDDEAVEYMQHTAPSAGVPSFVLPNSGADLQLIDTTGRVICFTHYDLSLYDDSKKDGGWSLEMIDTSNPCLVAENWRSSVSAEGGTPGAVNSVASSIANDFRIIKACCVNSNELLVEFSEMTDSLALADVSRFSVSPFGGSPVLSEPLPPDFRTVRLVFAENFLPGQLYTLELSPGLKNCTGDEIPASFEVPFALSEDAEAFDLVINEVLFNPLGDGVDYVEIFNRSEKAVDLEDFLLGSVKKDLIEPPDTQLVDISYSCIALLPGEYLVLTSDPDMVKYQYFTPDPDAFLKLSSFPSYNNDSGYVLLMKKDRLVMDGMFYSEEMHFLMMLSYEGVSLERINPDRLGYDPSNWHSAAETAGFGTPGYRNSQYLEMDETNDEVSVQPEVFSPDGDGKDDNLGIAYKFDTPGKLVNVLIFNSEGRLTRMLVNNEMPGTEGVFSWDGTMDDRTEAGNGIYVVYMEALGMDGKTKRYKKAAVLARNR